MKHIFFAALLLISLSSKSFSQIIVVGVNGDAIPIDTPKLVVSHLPLKTIKDTANNSILHSWFMYDSSMFKVTVSKGLTLLNPPAITIPVPQADWQQTYKSTSTNPTVLKFRNVPCSADFFMLFRNGSKRPQSEFTVDCINNVINFPAAKSQDTFDLVYIVTVR